MRVLVTGSRGFIGLALVRRLTGEGHTVIRLVRPQAGQRGGHPDALPLDQTAGTRGAPAPGVAEAAIAVWDPGLGELDPGILNMADAVIHLAGENLGARRWTAEAEADSRREPRPRHAPARGDDGPMLRPSPVLISASAVGYYGDRGDEIITEESGPGTGFVAGLVAEWEEAAKPAREAGIRVVHPRFGLILSPEGGALARLLLPFRFGLGARLGNGRQWMSWISLEDALDVILRLLVDPKASGTVNVVAPDPVRNAEFTRILGRVLSRPAFLAAPAMASPLRSLFGSEVFLRLFQPVT